MQENKILKLLLKIWIQLKIWFAKKNKWIHDLNKELDFFKSLKIKEISMDELEKHGIKYEMDFFNFFGHKILFDFQFDVKTLFTRKKGDCNSLNRFFQLAYYLSGYKFYLVSYIAKPFKMSHATVILEKDNKWFTADYGILKPQNNFFQALYYVSAKYSSKLLAYCVQDINWKILEEIK